MKPSKLTSRITMLKRPSLPTVATDRIRGHALIARNRKLRQENPYCAHCKAEGITRLVDEWDHIVPLAQGGADDASNIQGLCTEHHAAKSAREAAERANSLPGR